MRNAEQTKQRILEAAMGEFSAYGIMGARVDRIAKNAGCNKNMIYIYFENKQTLFNKILQTYLKRIYEDIIFTPKDLPGYAVRIFDYAVENPDLMRLLVWANIEQQAESLNEREVTHNKKVQMIEEAQKSGQVGSAFTPTFILNTIMTLATAWTVANPFSSVFDSNSIKNVNILRIAVAQAVELIVNAEKEQNEH